jgi:hypothetical protein
MVPSHFFIALAWFFRLCNARQQELHVDASSLIRASHIDCNGQHRVACETLQSSGVGADRTVHGFLLLPETKSRWQAFPVGLMLSQHSTAAREGSGSRIVFLTIGLILLGFLAYWLSHAEEPEEHEHDEAHFSKSSPWEEANRNAMGMQRESFDLLFKTGIVTKMDRSSETVKRGHIERCLQVAEELLREKPLSEWLKDRESTRRIFEDRLAEAYRSVPPSATPPTPIKDRLASPLDRSLDRDRSPAMSPYAQDRSPALTPYGTSPLREEVSHSQYIPEDATAKDASFSKFRGDDEFANDRLRDTPAFGTEEGDSRISPTEETPPGSAKFSPLETVSTVAAVDCGKQFGPASNSPASTAPEPRVPVLDLKKADISPRSTVPALDEDRQAPARGAISPRPKIHMFPRTAASSTSGSTSTSMPATVPALEEKKSASPLRPPRSLPLGSQRQQSGGSNPSGNESEGWPVVMKFPSKPSSTWESSASRSLEQKSKKPD